MTRMPRVGSPVGFEHVILKGAGSQNIFEDDADRETMLRLLGLAQRRWRTRLLAWCLMGNHVHLLIDDPEGEMSAFVHWVASTYAREFNVRWGHEGPVFRGRFHNVPVESERQLLAVVRYIHRNPVRAGLGSVEAYPWSSYAQYAEGPSTAHALCETDLVLELAGGREGFRELVRRDDASADEPPYYPRLTRRVPDDEVGDASAAAAWPHRPRELRQLPPERRDEHLRRMRDAGLSVRQIVRATGIGRYAVEKALYQRPCRERAVGEL